MQVFRRRIMNSKYFLLVFPNVFQYKYIVASSMVDLVDDLFGCFNWCVRTSNWWIRQLRRYTSFSY